MTHWTYKNQIVEEIPEGVYGFVYCVLSELTGKRYVGRKYVQSVRRKPLTKKQKASGRVRKDVIRKESDWRTYKGSCKPLLEEIDRIGSDQFKFEILAWGKTKGQVNFLEIYFQIKFNVIADDSYYNDAIGSGQFRNVKFDDDFKRLLLEL